MMIKFMKIKLTIAPKKSQTSMEAKNLLERPKTIELYDSFSEFGYNLNNVLIRRKGNVVVSEKYKLNFLLQYNLMRKYRRNYNYI